MKRNTKPDRPQKQIIPAGKIEPDAMYTAQGCKNWFGLGRLALLKARSTGIVKPIHCGRDIYYEGKQIIEWIRVSGRPAKKIEPREEWFS